jgi:hypothetical protein
VEQQANPAITPAQLDAYFNNLYQDLLSNPAISGLEISVHWGQVNPNPPTSTNPLLLELSGRRLQSGCGVERSKSDPSSQDHPDPHGSRL